MDELTRLALAARDGDRLALGSFIRTSQADVWRFCAHQVKPDQADDLTQEVFIRVWHALPRFRGEASARTWLLVIAARVCRQAQRSRRRHLSFDNLTRPPATSPDPGEAIALSRLFAELTPTGRAAFVLTQILGFSYAEAAEVCNTPVGTIRSRVARARIRLIEMLALAEAGHPC